MSNYVFVIDTKAQHGDPIHPAKARILLSQKKAAVFKRFPFTIILKEASEVKPIQAEIKLDPGSKVTGIAIVKNGLVIWAANLRHRGSKIKSDISTRKAVRRSRRQRKTRYRQARFLNRKRKKGWIAPSLKHRVLNVETWVSRIQKYVPVSKIIMELVKFDTQKMLSPEISGVEYQQGTLAGYEVREYLLEKFGRCCAYCDKKDVPLQIEHIHPKARGGGDRISNLTLSCDSCNQKKGTKSIDEFLKKDLTRAEKIKKTALAPLKDAAAVNTTRWKLFNTLKSILPTSTGTGGQTKYNRTRLGFDKDHYIDAACVGDVENLVFLTKKPLLITATGHGNRQMQANDEYGFPNKAARKVYNIGWKTGDIGTVHKNKGKSAGMSTGRVVVQNEKTLEVRIGKKRVSGKCSEFRKVHAKDGYKYNV